MVIIPAILACGKLPDPVMPDPSQEEQDENRENNGNSEGKDTTMPETIKITVAGKTLTVKIEENKATKSLVTALGESSITYTAQDYGGFEKVVYASC